MGDKVEVKIYGQTYSISGDKTQEEIEKIADYVDDRMHLVSKVMGRNGTGAVAVLSSINIAEEYFDQQEEMERLRVANQQLERDSAHYIKLWEDAKKNYKQTREAMEKLKLEGQKEDKRFQELQAKCSEFENQIFDLQMENIQLKSQIEKLQKG
ncbi:cell division protein ZapA [Hornefia butyriciproducens]|jgi:cell division protein ZapA (FtsZ GTPase activity inhibitor)|uniref:Cell division protein ZapA n=1 Tax=Hornefia butyriciproducens TaxID=2652293 RepID=A0A6L5Y4L0_9FIRM|nr:cell division protein ZapA [Hornefia butyriciproducens]MCI7412293.1 cell division protein ZapA [Clostridiales bacterium]MDD6299217.1 cell division protein ZapA [Hornefia butyriciproducens]MDD7019939.1 cell division protein ZapA [Hornefia butyriciproducens]MDY2990066.1 cell division protein ZapA [Hornefia butyriciproducens]MDY5424394.1 cell division protein ZapA [Hornefia butyriciproducens]